MSVEMRLYPGLSDHKAHLFPPDHGLLPARAAPSLLTSWGGELGPTLRVWLPTQWLAGADMGKQAGVYLKGDPLHPCAWRSGEGA